MGWSGIGLRYWDGIGIRMGLGWDGGWDGIGIRIGLGWGWDGVGWD